MAKPLHIFIGGVELIGYTSMTLRRDKEDMTGSMSVTLFMGYMPNEPVLDAAIRGAEITVYVNRQLAFTGIIDRRMDKGERSEDTDEKEPDEITSTGASGSIGPDQYTVTIQARGRTKVLVDASHRTDPTLLGQTNRSAIEALIEPFDVGLDWRATEVDIERVRFQDGSTPFEEITRIAENTALYVYEGVDGQLIVTDADTVLGTGEALVLGRNILGFDTEQLGDLERSEVVARGQLNAPGDYGSVAILPPIIQTEDSSVPIFTPVVVQVYGNGTPANLERITAYEANNQAVLSRKIDIEAFHIYQTDGELWDLSLLHQIAIPPAGVGGTFECTAIQLTVDADKRLRTRLSFSPPSTDANSSDTDVLSGVEISDFGGDPTGTGQPLGPLAEAWTGPTLTTVSTDLENTGSELLQDVEDALRRVPPLLLPDSFTDGLDDR